MTDSDPLHTTGRQQHKTTVAVEILADRAAGNEMRRLLETLPCPPQVDRDAWRRLCQLLVQTIEQRDTSENVSRPRGPDGLPGDVRPSPTRAQERGAAAQEAPVNTTRYPNPRGFDRRDVHALCPGSLLYALENNQIETDADYYWEDPVTGQWHGGYDPRHGASAGDRPSRGR